MKAHRTAVLWQVWGGIVAFIAIAASIGELLWWSLYISDPTNITRTWTAIVHATAGLAIILLVVYRSQKKAREKAGALDPLLREPDIPFHLGPFPVRVQASFFIAAILYGLHGDQVLRTAVFVVLATVAVLAHELGHALVASRELRGHVEILLHFAGGLTTYDARWLTRRQHILIALAGPLMGFVAGLIAVVVGLRFPSIRDSGIYSDALFVTLGWSALNLVPAWPLDGSVVVCAFLKRDNLLHPLSAIIAAVCGAICLELQQGHLLIFFAVLFIINVLAIPSVSRTVQRWSKRIG